MITSDTGLQYENIKSGNGPVVSSGQTVSVHYEVALDYESLTKGDVLDSSYIRKEAVSFKVGAGEALKGIDEAVQNMRVGDLWRLIIPPSLAFGDRGIKGVIPPNATLFVDIKLRYVE